MDLGKLMSDDGILTLCDMIRQTSYDIHAYLGHGHLEKVYENALAHRLIKRGIKVVQQHPLQVFDEDGTLIGSFLADLYYRGSIGSRIESLSEHHG
jgi:GxxExxY protein